MKALLKTARDNTGRGAMQAGGAIGGALGGAAQLGILGGGLGAAGASAKEFLTKDKEDREYGEAAMRGIGKGALVGGATGAALGGVGGAIIGGEEFDRQQSINDLRRLRARLR